MKVREDALATKSAELSAQTEELATLRTQVALFAEDQSKAVALAVAAREKELLKEFDFTKQFMKQTQDAERQMFETKLHSAEAQIQREKFDVQSLKDALAEANRQAQRLASTVVESVSGAKQMKTEEHKTEDAHG